MARCIQPWMKQGIELPCGKCYNCKARRVSGWSFRLMKQAEKSFSAYFITLTYDTDFVPITENGFMSLDKTDLQKFFKRLRKNHEKQKKTDPIKYYACGEYGGTTRRPHYHIILFQADIDLVAESWTLGSIHCGTVTEASVGYTLKYISKPAKIPQHQRDDRCREFSVMSKGLGKAYTTDAMIKWHRADLYNRMYISIGSGQRIAIPRYYYRHIYTPDERAEIGQHVSNQQVISFNKMSAKQKVAQVKKNTSIRNQLLKRSERDQRIKTVL